MKRIEAVIFDWAGTTVDYGCMAPIQAMKEAFFQYQLHVTIEQIRQPMGMLKFDHIKAVLDMDNVQMHFKNVYGRCYGPTDMQTIYSCFEKNIFLMLEQHTNVIDGMLNVQAYLRDQHIKIGSTTGYTKAMIDIVANSAKKQGYVPDYIISADQVLRGRPYPYMLQHNLIELNVKDVRSVIKVGDTIVDILEGLHAGCWSIGVIKGSSLLGLTAEEVAAMDAKILQQKMREVKYEMFAANADYVIDSIDELPWVINTIQKRMNGGQHISH